MQKITFEDLPSTNTPINANNLNQIQSNVEGAFKNIQTTSTQDGYSCNYVNGAVGNVLYDRTGTEGPDHSKSAGIKGTESISIDMSSYKRIKAYGYSNIRKYQFTLEIDLTDSLNVFQNVNKYSGTATIFTNYLSSEKNLFYTECSVTKNKQTFKVEEIGFYGLSSGAINTRNNTDDYVITKVIGYK